MNMIRSSDTLGTLYIVATPIGNLGDISNRAIETLNAVDVILAEDTRHSKTLLSKLGIQKPMSALHEHNERDQAEKLCAEILAGKKMALISDAGTPLISDPGYSLVRCAQDHGISVVPLPGPSAVITALSASGLPTDQFIFSGFLPAKAVARRSRLESLKFLDKTLIFFEAPHRIVETLSDMVQVFGETREAVIARELTKAFETIRRAPLLELFKWVKNDKDQNRGEIVVLVAGKRDEKRGGGNEEEELVEIPAEVSRMLKFALEVLPPKQAASLISKISGVPKRTMYDLAVKF